MFEIFKSKRLLWIIDENDDQKAVYLLRKELLKGRNINKTYKLGISTLMYASLLGKTRVVRFLIGNGADYEQLDNVGWNSLMYASRCGNFETCRFLVKHGSRINIQAIDGTTPLMVAASKGHFKVVKLLVKNGADIQIKNNTGISAIGIAERNGHNEIAEFLTPKEITFNESGVKSMNLGNYSEAIELFLQAIDLNPKYAIGYYNKGLCEFAIEEFMAAVISFSKAIDLWPNKTPNLETVYLNRGLSHMKLKRFEEAKSDYSRAIELNSTFRFAFVNRGIVNCILGNNEKVEYDIQRGKELGMTEWEVSKLYDECKKHR